MEDQTIVVMVTAPSAEVARKIAEALIERRLAACVNILPPLTSLYTWKGKLNEDQEILLLIKSRASLFEDRLAPVIRSLHPYEVPEIIALPIAMGSPPYLKWIVDST